MNSIDFFIKQKREEQGKNRLKKPYRMTKASYIVRILVGAYLLYTVYELMNNWQECTGLTLIFSVGGAITFIILGVFFLIHSVYMLQTGRYAGGAMDIDRGTESNKGNKTEN